MFEEPIDTISNREWEEALDAHIAWGETWHGDRKYKSGNR